ncbi:SET domain-containing protein [Mucilaginibacter sp. 14171R-50]|uniref:SET domain-containing protein-lysine N-methyltransferase n=1 Tax=Mucilaginibacter sp. 14171R-50 TaxID=2703789 RepID=UPI00138D05ED|nr:SET domain-containing protein [Mucilaginibacter sp. 14171R-50]QHS56540.1 SET domain-containing protein [Mucilaginibacter sp. 14171R-50]
MLLVETYIAPVEGKGMALFAKVPISKGTVYWRRDESFDRLFTPETLGRLPLNVISYIQIHGFQEVTGNWYLCGDNARFTNHSLDPNFINHYDEAGLVDYCFTDRDIAAGEEIVCDYYDTCQSCASGLPFEEVLN